MFVGLFLNVMEIVVVRVRGIEDGEIFKIFEWVGYCRYDLKR